MLKQITSPQNPLIKNIAVLGAKARDRREQGLFVAEGLREVELAFRSGFEAEVLLFEEAVTLFSVVENLVENAAQKPAEVIATSAQVFEKIAYRTGVPNVVAVFKMKTATLADLELSETPLLLIMESVEKPGNLGAMLRTADAAGVDAVLVCDPHTDVFNPNAIRASLGAIFTVPVVALASEEAVSFLRSKNIKIMATWLEAATSLYATDLRQPLAFVLGAEATGISKFWVEQADERIIIPMVGQVDSLNVSASAAIVLFEAVRQRGMI
ncbi:MAG: RNA methyltransferase [Saprospiraceae bacterium]|nr:RNA methyltransferase [Saprospiraceae bacterium]MCF8251082.1 RNA methyltransferase [Saprospiraceae bacterium]MCF8312862.1 RNA methyltransferase [Saprospiraceae bacterium]MCF8441341.1 RNA methyltransferase [Saprospiraceae bacterium]